MATENTQSHSYVESPDQKNNIHNMETDRTLLTKANADTEENDEQREEQIINDYLGKQDAIIESMGPYDQESNNMPK